MFTEMIKSEFKQLKGLLKLALVSIAIITGIICFITHLIFLITGVKSTGAIVLWHFITGIINMFLQFLYPLAALCLYILGGNVFYRNMYSANVVSANKLILSKFIPMAIFQILIRVALLVATERIMGGLDAIRYGYGYGISFGDIVGYSEIAFLDIYKLQAILIMSRNAKLYVLDEPFLDVDNDARDYILKIILSNYNRNATVLLSTILTPEVERIIDEVIFIKDGEIILYDAAEKIRNEKGCSIDEYFREVFNVS